MSDDLLRAQLSTRVAGLYGAALMLMSYIQPTDGKRVITTDDLHDSLIAKNLQRELEKFQGWLLSAARYTYKSDPPAKPAAERMDAIVDAVIQRIRTDPQMTKLAVRIEEK